MYIYIIHTLHSTSIDLLFISNLYIDLFSFSYSFYQLQQAFSKDGYLEIKGVTGFSPYYLHFKGNRTICFLCFLLFPTTILNIVLYLYMNVGNIIKYYNEPNGRVRGKINILGCSIQEDPNNTKKVRQLLSLYIIFYYIANSS